MKLNKHGLPQIKLTYRKGLNLGYEPVHYHTDRGNRTAWIVKRGSKWMHLKWGDGSGNKRVPLSHERYMTPFTSKRG